MALIMQADAATIVQDRVIVGARLLDIHTPSWAGRVNQRLLDMSSYKDDVLAQVYRDARNPADNGYSWAINKLRVKLGEQDYFGENPVNDWLERHGFKQDPFLNVGGYSEDQQNQDLRRFWLHEVEVRSGQGQEQAQAEGQ